MKKTLLLSLLSFCLGLAVERLTFCEEQKADALLSQYEKSELVDGKYPEWLYSIYKTLPNEALIELSEKVDSRFLKLSILFCDLHCKDVTDRNERIEFLRRMFSDLHENTPLERKEAALKNGGV